MKADRRLPVADALAVRAYRRLARREPLPYAAASELVRGFSEFPSMGFDRFWFSWGQYNLLREQNQTFAALGVYGHTRSGNLSGVGTPVQVRGATITHTLFPTLGVTPALGRNITVEEDVPNGPPVVVLGHDLWQAAFGGDAAIVGRTIQLDGASREVIGVMAAGFRLPTEFGDLQPAELWTPMAREYST